jgi:repressor of nif and glnA expression
MFLSKIKRDAFDIKVRDIFEANRKIYGSRRISKELKRLGINAGRYKVRQAMARLGLEVRL